MWRIGARFLLSATVQPPTPLEREIAFFGQTLGARVVVVVMATLRLISGVHTLADAVTGLSGLEGLVLGSVSHSAIHSCPCPVAVLHG